MIYLWRIPEDYPERHIGIYDRERSPDRFLFRKGIYLEETIGTPIIRFNDNPDILRKWDVLVNNAIIPLINDRVVNILNNIAYDDIQLFDSVIETPSGNITDYKFLNVIKTVSCIDHDNSEYSYVENTNHIMGFSYLNLLFEKMGQNNLAREYEYHSFLYVSKKVWEAFKVSRIKGVALLRPEEIL